MRAATTYITALAIGICTMGASGCSILSAQPDPSRFFVLTHVPNADAPPDSVWSAVPSRMHGISLGLGPVTVPGYLDRSEIATRVSPTQVSYSSTNRWAESLPVSVSRVLSENLATLLGTDRIVQYPWFGNISLDYLVEIEILRFESSPTGAGELNARWAIRDGHSRKYLVVRETRIVSPSSAADTAAAVAALSTSLDGLSREIAAALQQLPPPATPHP